VTTEEEFVASHVVYPVRLGTFPNAEYSHFVLNTRVGEKFDAGLLSYLIRADEALLVVDTGFCRPPEGMGPLGDAKAAYAAKLAELGRTFDDVTHIVLTHLHWDHMQCNHLFPNAKIFVQRQEVAAAAAPVYPLYYEHEDIGRMIAEDGGRLVFLDGDEAIVPGVTAVFAGGHTLGSQLVYVATSEGTAVISGDVLNVYENLETRSVKEVDVVAWVRAVARIKKDADVVLPMHDLRVLDKHPVVGA